MILPPFPPFESVLKSRDVEDPVNLWLHRPLAYAFAWAVYRTPMTPNQITLLALLVGVAAGASWVAGTPEMMVLGGVLLWLSAILDGADGILARAKDMYSDLGRALDGTADAAVVLVSVAGGVYHLWSAQPELLSIPMIGLCIVSAIVHTHLYDFYKESYMHSSDPAWKGQFQSEQDLTTQLEQLKSERAHWTGIVATDMTRGLTRNQGLLVRALDPEGVRDGLRFEVNARSIAIHRRNNRRVMKAWSFVSLAPHAYLMSICGMVDRLDLYVWLRVVPLNALFLVIVLWQRHASAETRRELREAGMAPVALA